MALCERLGIPLQLGPVPVAALRAADEVFITSTGGGVLPIARLDGQVLPHFPGPLTERLQQAYWEAHHDPAWSDPVDYG
jgi:branched-chain amino acid aminotransferase